MVAPHTGAWIETWGGGRECIPDGVAPHTGAWIETEGQLATVIEDAVAPHTGAWIETWQGVPLITIASRRPPHGGVD